MLDSDNLDGQGDTTSTDTTESTTTTTSRRRGSGRPAGPPVAVSFQAPPQELAPARPEPEPERAPKRERDDSAAPKGDADDDARNDDDTDDDGQPKRRRRSRGGRRRRKSDGDTDQDDSADEAESEDSDDSSDDGEGGGNSSRRRRRRARAGQETSGADDDPENTVVKVRQGRSAEDEITGVTGSTRLEAKKQRRREGREAGRRRAPIVSEAEFLARRESVKRDMVVRQKQEYTQIAVLEDGVLVEHYVARESQTSMIGNVYLGKVQNVLPSMEAAFVDIGAGRNAVIYAGEVDWSTLPNGKPRKIEEVLSPGQVVLVQVSKDPIGQKGARLTSQVSLPGRFMVLVPGGQTSGISRKLPENERARLKALLKDVLPDEAGFIVRTAAEGASEDQLNRDVSALTARWKDIESKVSAGKAPELLYSEPDLMIKVIRDLFNEDFASLVVEGDDVWDMVNGYVDHVAPDLAERVSRWIPEEHDGVGAFGSFRVDEQIAKALDRKVHLPSGGSLIIDRTEAMTVVDVNTGKYTGSGGNLEETVTKNNLEAAEEVVRQLRLRDIGGIIVVDFIDMVLESNRELVLRRLVECLGRDRTRHQVAEVTSLGLVQMTRKRIGTGLLESFSTDCEHCKGRGVVISDHPVEPKREDSSRRGGRGGRGRGGNGGNNQGGGNGTSNGGGTNKGGGNNNQGGGSNRRGGGDQQAKQQESGQQEATADAPKQEAPKQESKADAPKQETPKQDAPVPAEAPQTDAAPAAETKPKATRTRRAAATRPAGKPKTSDEGAPVLTDEGQSS